jgi:uncharacterized protein DUF6632
MPWAGIVRAVGAERWECGGLVWDQVRCVGRVQRMRERVLKAVLGVVGVLFLATAYPMVVFVRQEPSLSMMFSLYVVLGVFLLLAIRDPWASRSVIAFTAWSSLAHAGWMGMQAGCHMVAMGEMIGVAVLAVIGVTLIALAPQKPNVKYAVVL